MEKNKYNFQAKNIRKKGFKKTLRLCIIISSKIFTYLQTNSQTFVTVRPNIYEDVRRRLYFCSDHSPDFDKIFLATLTHLKKVVSVQNFSSAVKNNLLTKNPSPFFDTVPMISRLTICEHPQRNICVDPRQRYKFHESFTGSMLNIFDDLRSYSNAFNDRRIYSTAIAKTAIIVISGPKLKKKDREKSSQLGASGSQSRAFTRNTLS